MKKIEHLFDRSVEWMVVLLFVAFSVIMFVNVVGRYVFNFSFVWSDEFIRYTFIWMILLGSGVAIKRKAHLGFDLIISKLPLKLQTFFVLLNDVLISIFLILFFFNGINLLKSAGMTPSPSMNIPMAFVYIVLPLSSIIMFIYIISSIWRTIRYGIEEQRGIEDTDNV
ncbi:TRAP transporter small permease [Alkalihalobacillus oceani]|uniref:TRAP transporter small permease n=1 Tax=Halalkalibacter oceani TaxID=1653776 RepID=A0A9X2IS97_9BACI|nr:TRAP transporter small permease [Halalkalibacter oceani]MCM3716303.1 TRAP transporter small permease [Halalkalibacter oceani]